MSSIESVPFPNGNGRGGVSGWLVLTLFVFATAVAAIPIFANQFLSINDYPNHLARAAVLLNYYSNPAFSRYYIPHWGMLPNLASDLWIVGLGHILPVEIAGKLFVAATFALMLGGTICIHFATFRRWSLWPLLAVVLLYNRLVPVGLLDFLFGTGVGMLVLSLWIYLRSRPPLIRGLSLTAGTLVVFFAHLFAFGVLAVTIATYELVLFASGDRPFRKRLLDLAAGAVPFLPAIAILVALSPHSHGTVVIRYRDIWTRISGFTLPIIYDGGREGLCFLALSALTAWALASQSIRFNRPLTAGVIALFLLQFCMPNVIMTAELADQRLPIPMMLLAVAATDLVKASYKLRAALVLTTGAVFAFRIVGIQQRWAQEQPTYAAAGAALAQIPGGARVATALAPDTFNTFRTPYQAIYYMPVWSVVSRGGFTQTLFALPTQHPLVLKPEYAALAAASRPSDIWQGFVLGAGANSCAPPPRLISALRGYDYVAFVDRRKFRVCHTPLLDMVADAGYAQVFRVNPGL